MLYFHGDFRLSHALHRIFDTAICIPLPVDLILQLNFDPRIQGWCLDVLIILIFFLHLHCSCSALPHPIIFPDTVLISATFHLSNPLSATMAICWPESYSYFIMLICVINSVLGAGVIREPAWRGNAPFIRSLVVGEERMRPGHWFGSSVLCVFITASTPLVGW